MATSLKRVISHPEEVGKLAKKTTMQIDAKDSVIEDDRIVPALTATEIAPPAVVEVDNPIENVPVVHVRFQEALSDVSFPSSLSETSTGVLVDFIPRDSGRNETQFHRVDSANSVGSGSGGSWGWFQEVHGTPQMMNISQHFVDDGELGSALILVSIVLC